MNQSINESNKMNEWLNEIDQIEWMNEYTEWNKLNWTNHMKRMND